MLNKFIKTVDDMYGDTYMFLCCHKKMTGGNLAYFSRDMDTWEITSKEMNISFCPYCGAKMEECDDVHTIRQDRCMNSPSNREHYNRLVHFEIWYEEPNYWDEEGATDHSRSYSHVDKLGKTYWQSITEARREQQEHEDKRVEKELAQWAEDKEDMLAEHADTQAVVDGLNHREKFIKNSRKKYYIKRVEK